MSLVSPAYVTAAIHDGYTTVLYTATLSAFLFVGAWILAMLLGLKDKSRLRVWFWLSWLLIVPITTHIVGGIKFSKIQIAASLEMRNLSPSDINIAGMALDSLQQSAADSLDNSANDTAKTPF